MSFLFLNKATNRKLNFNTCSFKEPSKLKEDMNFERKERKTKLKLLNKQKTNFLSHLPEMFILNKYFMVLQPLTFRSIHIKHFQLKEQKK